MQVCMDLNDAIHQQATIDQAVYLDALSKKQK